jgi:putative polyhydroxyalkanoate system protein
MFAIMHSSSARASRPVGATILPPLHQRVYQRRRARVLGALQHGTARGIGYTWKSRRKQQRSPSMPSISIKRRHKLDAKRARTAAQKIAKDLNKRYGLICQWDGDEVTFDGVGVSGNMQVGKSQIKLDVQLSFLLAPLKGPIEREINKQLDTLLVKA